MAINMFDGVAQPNEELGLDAQSVEALAEIVYNTVYYDPGNRDLFHYWKHEWIPAVQEMLEFLTTEQKASLERKNVAKEN